MPKIKSELTKLSKMDLEVGILDNAGNFIKMIANVNEFGMTIKAKKQWLTIPLNNESTGKRAKDFPGIFKPKGKRILAIKDGDGIKPMFALVKEVRIPQRSFVRSTYTDKKDEWNNLISNQIFNIVLGRQTAEGLLILLGNTIKREIQQTITNKKTPKNSPITIANKGRDDPLVDTGKMRASVSYNIIKH